MTPEEGRSAREGTLPGRQYRKAEHTLDVLAKGLAGEGLSRGQALRMVGAALAGAALAVFVPGVARARQDGPVDHGPNGPVNHGPPRGQWTERPVLPAPSKSVIGTRTVHPGARVRFGHWEALLILFAGPEGEAENKLRADRYRVNF